MTRVIDISLPIGPDLLTWPNDPPVQVHRTSHLATDGANVSELRMGTHTGTHVDPPVHFVEGAAGIDEVPLDLLLGAAFVADARGMAGALGPGELEELAIPHDATRVLLKSDNSELWRSLPVDFPDEYVCLSAEGARWVVERGIRVFGTDFLSIERKGSPGHPVHVELLSHGVVIVEGLNLGDVDPGPASLACLPLRIVAGDGGPARAVLLTD
jgi:arylformamidase